MNKTPESTPLCLNIIVYNLIYIMSDLWLNLQCITDLKVCGGNSTNMLMGTLLVLLNFLPCNVYTKLCLSVSHSDYTFVGAL